MSNVQIMTGNSAAAYGAKLCKVQVVSAYPITPSTSVNGANSRPSMSGWRANIR